MRFKRIATTRLYVSRGLTLLIDYEGPPSVRKKEIVENQIIPVIVQAPALIDALRKIAEARWDSMFGEHMASAVLAEVQKIARSAIPKEGVRIDFSDVNDVNAHRTP